MSRKIVEVTIKVKVQVTSNSDELGEVKNTLHILNKIAKEQFHQAIVAPNIDVEDISYSDIKG